MHARNVRVHSLIHNDTQTHVQTRMSSYAHVRGRKQPLKPLGS
jgi:hypothetical protein